MTDALRKLPVLAETFERLLPAQRLTSHMDLLNLTCYF
jgi:hypothetical protein